MLEGSTPSYAPAPGRCRPFYRWPLPRDAPALALGSQRRPSRSRPYTHVAHHLLPLLILPLQGERPRYAYPFSRPSPGYPVLHIRPRGHKPRPLAPILPAFASCFPRQAPRPRLTSQLLPQAGVPAAPNIPAASPSRRPGRLLRRPPRARPFAHPKGPRRRPASLAPPRRARPSSRPYGKAPPIPLPGQPLPPFHTKIRGALSSSSQIGIRRRPTLPGRCQPSTLGAEGLNCCVRYGNRWIPLAIATGNGNRYSLFSPAPSQLHNVSLPALNSVA